MIESIWQINDAQHRSKLLFRILSTKQAAHWPSAKDFFSLLNLKNADQ